MTLQSMIISWFDKYIMIMVLSLDEVHMETLCTIFATFLEIEVYSKLKKKSLLKCNSSEYENL